MPYDIPIPVTLGSGDTGLTLKAQRVDRVSGANVGTAITTGFVEIGLGFYQWAPFDVPAGFVGGIKILDSSNNLKAFGAFNAAEYELTVARVQNLDNLDAQVSQVAAGAAGVTNAVLPGDDLYLIIGDSYLAADNRAFSFPDAKGQWAAFASAKFFAQDDTEGVDCEIVNPDDLLRVVRAEFTSEYTSALAARKGVYSIQATDVDEHVFTIVRGRLIVKEPHD